MDSCYQGGVSNTAREYVKQWSVPSRREGQPPHKVSLRKDGGYECDCWPWKKTRRNCDHINRVIDDPESYSGAELPQLTIIPANVGQVKREGNRLLVPLIPLGRAETTQFLATICYDLIRSGATWLQVRTYYKNMVPREWTREAITRYIEAHGRLVQTQESLHARHSDIPRFETMVTFEGVEGKKSGGAARMRPAFAEANEE